jgi:hypothetical protein
LARSQLRIRNGALAIGQLAIRRIVIDGAKLKSLEQKADSPNY